MKKIRAYRITKTRYLEEAFTGAGARRYGGRWNTKGTSMIYASSGIALATLEILVHAGPIARLRDLFSVCAFEFSPGLLMDLNDLAPEEEAGFESTIDQGTHWVRSGKHPVLRVPSAILDVPDQAALDEPNYLINPEHERFGEIELLESFPLKLDPRLHRNGG